MTINEMKQSYKQSYTDNVELSIFNCGHQYCQPGHTWGPGVRDHYLIHLVVAGKGVYQVNGALHTLQAVSYTHLVGAVGAAGEDDALGVFGLDFGKVGAVRINLAIYAVSYTHLSSSKSRSAAGVRPRSPGFCCAAPRTIWI